MQRCNRERMRDKDIKFIHILSIVTVVYSNGINLKILMSHWRHLTTTFKFPQVSCIVLLDNVIIHKQLSSSNVSQHASIRLCTLCFRVIQYSMECPGTPPCCIRVVSSVKWSLRNLCKDYGYYCIIE